MYQEKLNKPSDSELWSKAKIEEKFGGYVISSHDSNYYYSPTYKCWRWLNVVNEDGTFHAVFSQQKYAKNCFDKNKQITLDDVDEGTSFFHDGLELIKTDGNPIFPNCVACVHVKTGTTYSLSKSTKIEVRR